MDTTEEIGKKEVKTNIRTFKSSPEVENFYRFISENGLRREARMIVEVVHKAWKNSQKKNKKRGRKKKTLQ